MRVAIVSTLSKRGAGTAAFRQHQALRQAGVDSHFFCTDLSDSANHVHKFEPRIPLRFTLAGAAKRHLRLPIANGWHDPWNSLAHKATTEVMTSGAACGDEGLLDRLATYDVVNLHWVSKFIDYKSLISRVGGKVPLVWTLHDMNPMTGGCHYSQGCQRYSDRCGDCPQLIASGPGDASARVFARRKNAYASLGKDHLHIVTLCSWMTDQLKKSNLFRGFQYSQICNGIDTEFFYPLDKKAARDALGIEEGLPLVVFVSDDLGNRRKGMDLLLGALERLSRSSTFVQLLSVGKGHVSVPGLVESRYHSLGNVLNPYLMRVVYSAADAFVIPSREDNLPNTVMESLACGTPVIGFDVGGIPDMVVHGETGWLAKGTAAESLASTIEFALSELSLTGAAARIRDSCLRKVNRDYAFSVHAAAYLRLYQSLLAN